MIYLVDTDVLSLLRRPDRAKPAVDWFRARSEAEIYLSAVTIGEIARGIERQRHLNPGFADDLSAWLSRTEVLFADRILPFASEEARLWGKLSARLGHFGVDLMIAATALTHGATVVSRNVSDFLPAGVPVVDPMRSDLPPTPPR